MAGGRSLQAGEREEMRLPLQVQALQIHQDMGPALLQPQGQGSAVPPFAEGGERSPQGTGQNRGDLTSLETNA